MKTLTPVNWHLKSEQYSGDPDSVERLSNGVRRTVLPFWTFEQAGPALASGTLFQMVGKRDHLLMLLGDYGPTGSTGPNGLFWPD